jgi:hypothetical protein
MVKVNPRTAALISTALKLDLAVVEHPWGRVYLPGGVTTGWENLPGSMRDEVRRACDTSLRANNSGVADMVALVEKYNSETPFEEIEADCWKPVVLSVVDLRTGQRKATVEVDEDWLHGTLVHLLKDRAPI